MKPFEEIVEDGCIHIHVKYSRKAHVSKSLSAMCTKDCLWDSFQQFKDFCNKKLEEKDEEGKDYEADGEPKQQIMKTRRMLFGKRCLE